MTLALLAQTPLLRDKSTQELPHTQVHLALISSIFEGAGAKHLIYRSYSRVNVT